MLVAKLWSHLRGYVIIRAHGSRLEALINAAVRDGIPLWALQRAAPEFLVLRVGAADFRRLARIGQALGVRVTVIHKKGLPFLLWRARSRQMFVFGGALFVALLYVLAQFVWFVRIEGTEKLTADEVLVVAARHGLRPGVRRDALSRQTVENNLYLEIPRLAWAAVQLRGAVATVHVVERTELDDELQQVGHMVATVPGVVDHVVVTRGSALVGPGDTVEAGQPLISGMLAPGGRAYEERLAAGELPLLRAQGTVRARVWYEAYVEQRYGGPSVPETFAAAGERAVAVARDEIAGRLPADAEIVDETVAVTDDTDVVPHIARATLTVVAVQNIARFESVAAPDDFLIGNQKDDDGDQKDDDDE